MVEVKKVVSCCPALSIFAKEWLAFPRESNFLEGRCRRANLVRVILGFD